jgi:valyl-tRNA synthetase
MLDERRRSLSSLQARPASFPSRSPAVKLTRATGADVPTARYTRSLDQEARNDSNVNPARAAEQAELASRYDPSGLEGALYDAWKEAGAFHAHVDAPEDPYVIVIPPPNVTAALHMGHGLNNTIQDVLIRWRRMQGREALYLPGTDHAGIATQNVVERHLAAEGETRFDLGREAFVERVWEWVRKYEARILHQLEVIGCSCDWGRTRFTLDEGLSRAVREVFVRLYEKGLVYRGRYIINWCPRCRTALSNEEAEHREHAGKLYHIRYPLAKDAGRFLEVATTRPETMLGDTGLAVHPDDERYTEFVGQDAILPLVGRDLPIVADVYVDPEFGSGVVKVTPAHDPNDFEIGQRHDLDTVDAMTDAAEMSGAVPEAYRGLDRFEARERVLEDLESEGLLVRVEDHPHSVGHCYRCATIVEPRLSLQWFVKMQPLAEPALAVYRDGRLRFHPERYGRVYANWMENIRDWCISRQLWWGHRIPVWYCQADECGEMIVARDDPEACPGCGGSIEQDTDVLDTWFSSWLWPFSTLGWPDQTEDLERFYPGDTLVTADEILFFWVARMVMAGCEFMDGLPFTDVLLNGTVRDHLGRRMSKSLGNGIDPMEVVDMYGADAMRFTLIRGAPLGTDLHLNYEDLDTAFRPGRNFANKIWNAARFALPHLGDVDVTDDGPFSEELADRWIRSRLRRTETAVTEALEGFRLHEAAELCHGFVWGEFCDWYLELVKSRLEGSDGEDSRRGAAHTLAHVMLAWLKLLHPIMPFISDAIAGRMPGVPDSFSIVRGPWPDSHADWEDSEAEETMGELQELIGTVRTLRAEYGVDQKAKIVARIGAHTDQLKLALENDGENVRRLAGVETIETLEGTGEREPGAHAVLRSGTELFVPLSGVIDLDREGERIRVEVERVSHLLARTRAKLANEGFLANAPAEVLDREKEKECSLAEQHDRLEEKYRALRSDI